MLVESVKCSSTFDVTLLKVHLIYSTTLDVEYWIDSDFETDEDVSVEDAHIPPPELDPEPTQDAAEVNLTLWWIVTLLSIFQTQFYVTNRALTWLLNFLFVVFRYLGRYSATIASLAQKFPRSFHQYSSLMPMIMQDNSFHR